MKELTIGSEPFEGGIRLRLQGILDGSGAYALRDRIFKSDMPVIVDCSKLDHLSDFGLGIVAMAVAEMERDVQFCGLGNHAQRILRAFGVSRAA